MEPAVVLKLHAHPLSSYCHKVLIALYELQAPFDLVFLNLGDAEHRARFFALWPMGKMPVLQDEAAGVALPESSIIIDFLNRRFHGGLIPADPDQALLVRARDRFFDTYVHTPMQAITADLLRPAAERDPFGVAQAKARLAQAYDVAEGYMAGRDWAAGDAFSMADCAAASALFYGDMRVPLAGHPNLMAYLDRLKARPSYARVLQEAAPYLHMVPR